MSATESNSPHQHPTEGFEIVQLRGTRQAETGQKERPYTTVMTRTRESVDMMTASRTDLMARSHSQPGLHLQGIGKSGNQMSWDRMRRKQEGPKSYEEWCRNRRIGQNEGLQQSSSRSVVERLYDRSRPNQYEWDLTAKPAGISSIVIV
ncbi:uncharacterized protein UHOD_11297 [Ustilago sp. UG-2017b]|nr:uncharacterized protein UHOD_11297 [Ustilago sp. UG-2017b]